MLWLNVATYCVIRCQFLALITGKENTYFERSFEALGVTNVQVNASTSVCVSCVSVCLCVSVCKSGVVPIGRMHLSEKSCKNTQTVPRSHKSIWRCKHLYFTCEEPVYTYV